MATNNNAKHGASVFRTVCQALDDRKWVYQKDEANLHVRVTVTGEDLPMTLNIRVDDENDLVKIHSTLFKISEEKRVEGALVISAINYRLIDGCFDYDLRDGEVLFRQVSCYRGGIVGKGMIDYMIRCSLSTIDEYNDDLLMYSKGILSFDDIIKKINE